METDWQLLKAGILRHSGQDSGAYATKIEWLTLHRHDHPESPLPFIFKPVIIVVAQGSKLVRVGDRELAYGDRAAFICGIDLPASSCVLEASQEKPYLALSIDLDSATLVELAAHERLIETSASSDFTAQTGELDPDLLDALTRLMELLDRPERLRVLAPQIFREIHYLLLLSSLAGACLSALATAGTQMNAIARAIIRLRENFSEKLSVEEMAAPSGMASSTFHKYFKAFTSVSPLQYQKLLRLHKARALLLTGHLNVTGVSEKVGYESTTQFIREYKRLFGKAPKRDIGGRKEK